MAREAAGQGTSGADGTPVGISVVYTVPEGVWQRADAALRFLFSMTAAAPIYYQCQRCTNCCRWPGFVKVDDADITALAAHLGLTEHDFIQRYTRLRPQRDGLALIDKPGGECVFLDGQDCAVQPVKPGQCQGFPNVWNFPGWQEVCEAKPVVSR